MDDDDEGIGFKLISHSVKILMENVTQTTKLQFNFDCKKAILANINWIGLIILLNYKQYAGRILFQI